MGGVIVLSSLLAQSIPPYLRRWQLKLGTEDRGRQRHKHKAGADSQLDRVKFLIHAGSLLHALLKL